MGCPSTGGAVRASVVASRDSIWNARTWVDVPTISHQRFGGRFVFPSSCVGQVFPRLATQVIW